MSNNKKCLYSCESEINAYEYKKMVKYFPKGIYSSLVIRSLTIDLILCLAFALISGKLVNSIIFFTIFEIILMIIYWVKLDYFAGRTFESINKNGLYDESIKTEFYDDYFVRKGKNLTLTIKYQEISRCIEDDDNFYLEYLERNMIIIFQKIKCDLELINFIREKFPNIENHIGNNSNFKGVKKYHHPKFIKNGMIILFIITILSLWGALYSIELVQKTNPQHGFNFTKNMWVFWCFLPISILSIVLGFKYKNAGFKCTKNIVAGFIVGFLLLIYGSFSMFPTFEEDYNKINDYKEIIDAKLPSDGELEIQNWETYFDEDKTEYVIINAYYDMEDVSNLVDSIENSNNWILSKEIKSELKIFIPTTLSSDDDAYYSIYNKTTDEYNILPINNGNYEIYAMKYDKSDKKLEIHKFKYLYR